MRELEAAVKDAKGHDREEKGANGKYRKHREPKPFLPQGKNQEAQFKSWAFVFAGHVEHVCPGTELLLEWASKQDEEITESQLRSYRTCDGTEFDALQASHLLYDELRGLCPEGEPQTIIKNTRVGKRCVEAWRRICFRYDPKGVLVAQGIMEQIQLIEWPRTMTGVHEMLEKVEALTLEYATITGKSYPEESLQGRIMAIMPEHFKGHIRNNLQHFTTYQHIHDYLIQQVRLKKDEEARAAGVGTSSTRRKEEVAATVEEVQ